MRSARGIPIQEPYIRSRENPYFDGLLRDYNASRNQSSALDFQGNDESRNISRTTSDISDARSKSLLQDISEKSMESPEDSLSDIVLYPIEQSTFGRLSKIAKATSFGFPNIQADLSSESGGTLESMKESSPKASEATEECPSEATEECHTLSTLARPIIEKSYSLNPRKQNLSSIPLPQSAASFYSGFSPLVEVVESCESINRLNLYLKCRRDDVSSGVPGRFLHAVIGQDVSDLGSIAATIMYAFYLNETLESDQLCTVPVINMKREDLSSHAEMKWLLDSCQIDELSLIFVDEDSSCCTLIAEKFALTSPEILVAQGFSRLLLAGILLDTGNLTGPHCTTKDKYMATLLVNGAGRFGSNGLYQLLRYKMYDTSDLTVVDILRKDFKKWTRVGKPDNVGSRSVMSYIGISSIGISIEQLLAREASSTGEIKYFQQLEKLRLLMIVSGYYDSQKNFKREILVTAESVELTKNLLTFLNSNASRLPLKVLHNPGLKEEMKLFEIENITSRKTIERLLEEFGGASKG
ncbi:uncharacterized protein LOC110603340 isoform X3 [Manihot esculenta]|uniref:DHHA2 domain-containing protein n=1 Tax=Manihot esculenta TaxID=3983 RepID=A0A2C9U9F4_MANES|nr:uncharacterized protein LOC110603340 isoform X3 [Manihot esculenta]